MARNGWATKRGWRVVALDILGLAIALVLFALFHHVLPVYGGGAKLHIVSVGSEGAHVAASPAAGAPAQAEGSASKSGPDAPAETKSIPAPTYPPGDFSASFPAYDTGAGKYKSYQSNDLRIAIDLFQKSEVTGYIADIWIRNISSFRTAFAKGRFGQGIHEMPIDMADQNHAILAISGDYYGAREKGIVIRNGDLYRDTVNADTCVLYADGMMETFHKSEFNLQAAENRGAYQAWSFGPSLLEGGLARETFDSAVQGLNPRSAIGYYEPGHYCFVVIDGRQAGYSKGATLQQLAKLFESLGCREAYNLDGGKSAMMVFDGDVVSRPYDGGRKISDIIYIGGLPQ